MKDKHKKVLNLLVNSKDKFTAIEINNIINSSDARKIISDLRKQGHQIKDEIIDIKRTKKYFIVNE